MAEQKETVKKITKKSAPKKMRKKEITCSYCGAPVISEVCSYCGNRTGLNTKNATMEYPEIECKETHLDFWTIGFPAAFALTFGGLGVWFPLFMWYIGMMETSSLLLLTPFAVVGLISTYSLFKKLWLCLSVKIFGKSIDGIVYGYTDDTIEYNSSPGQTCKILVTTSKGPRFIMYQLGRVDKPYEVNSKVTLKVYKNRFSIIDKHKYDAWD